MTIMLYINVINGHDTDCTQNSHSLSLSLHDYRGYKLMKLQPNFVAKRPEVAEHDFAGTIAALGPPLSKSKNHSSLKVGQRVYGYAEGPSKGTQGSLAEYLVLDSDLVAAVPKDFSMEEAAGFPIIGMTATLAIEEANVENGQSVFVIGGKFGVHWNQIDCVRADLMAGLIQEAPLSEWR